MSGVTHSSNQASGADVVLSKPKDELKVMLAEDNKVNQKLAVLLFKKIGLSPKVVSSGQEAVSEATDNEYDLIFMDVYMPGMDGMEASRTLKKKLGDACPPIIALTASNMNGDREKFMESGMDDYIAKPINFQVLSDYIQRFIQS